MIKNKDDENSGEVERRRGGRPQRAGYVRRWVVLPVEINEWINDYLVKEERDFSWFIVKMLQRFKRTENFVDTQWWRDRESS